MEKTFSSIAPESIERFPSRRIINFDIRLATEEEIKDKWISSGNEGDEPTEYFISNHKWVYYQITLSTARWYYTGVVEAIVRAKYSTDEMEAITNNMNASVGSFFNALVSDGIVGAIKYLKDSANEDNTIAFREMQEWRAKAKAWAREVFKK